MEFVKLHGTGNDFVVIDARSLDRDWSALAREVCDRHFGIGGDGLILAVNSDRADVRMRIFNADGSEAEMSGNGMRCLVKFAVDGGIVAPKGEELDVETGAGVMRVSITTARRARRARARGHGRAAPRPARDTHRHRGRAARARISVDGRRHDDRDHRRCRWGTPTPCTSSRRPSRTTRCTSSGPLMEHHALFPQRTNFEVVRIIGKGRAEMRVWERGVGETLSCGSGASAVMVAARLGGLAEDGSS